MFFLLINNKDRMSNLVNIIIWYVEKFQGRDIAFDVGVGWCELFVISVGEIAERWEKLQIGPDFL